MTLTLWNTPTSKTKWYYDDSTKKIVVFDKGTNSVGFSVSVYYVMAILIATGIIYWYERM